MKFKTFLNETFIPKENILKILQKNCGPFLNELKKHLNGELLYTGRKNVSSPFAKKQVRSDRKPTDTPKEIHQLVDK